ncbi:MAG: T9SS type A sorting domain-containing protein, partial [Candidatus Marinimicrobia bacterium]|nr:T9SS type A sorting domain-containing protein [Candidatus Neomarinimicrobiota bacterium]
VCDGTNDCVGCTDPLATNYCDTCTIEDFSCEYPVGEPVHFIVEIEPTGVSSLVSISDILCFTEGDEIGLYDASGQTNFNDCTSQTGEILVGSGVFTGGQLDVVGIGSVDLCAFGGVQLPGYFDGHPIVFKAWDSETDYEYTLSASQVNLILGNGTWGQVITQIDIDACSIVQQINLNALMWNNISFYVAPLDNEITSVFADVPVLVAKDDASHYYAPSIPVNTIGNMIPEKGYQVFLSGMEDHLLEVTGTLIDPASMPITINALMMNNIAYLLSTSSNIADVMADIPVLVAKDASGHYYVPGIGVNTIDGSGGMQPGMGYEIFLMGSDAAVLTYSEMGMGRSYVDPYAEAVLIASQSQHYNIVPTGLSHPVIITDIQGVVGAGDEVAAYAGGVLVGATRIIDTDAPIVIATWEGYHELGVDVDGYTSGDAIELRVWSQSAGKELRVSAELDGNFYGVTPLTTGSITVVTEDVIPVQFELVQNYPNPFNPSTTIGFNLPVDASISLTIYDISGRKVQTLVENSVVTAGYHSLIWDGKDLNGTEVSAGIYVYSLQGEGVSIARKMIMMK